MFYRVEDLLIYLSPVSVEATISFSPVISKNKYGPFRSIVWKSFYHFEYAPDPARLRNDGALLDPKTAIYIYIYIWRDIRDPAVRNNSTRRNNELLTG